MSGDSEFPPVRELPAGRHAQRRQHLIGEIAAWDTRARTPRVRRVRFVYAVVATAVLVVAAVLVSERAGSGNASAADVRTKLAQALRLRESISGEFSVESRDPGPRPRGAPGCVNCTPIVPLPSRFVIGTDGSYSKLTLPLDARHREDVAYNASTGVETRFPVGESSGRPVYLRGVNVDPALIEDAPEPQLAAWVKGALADRDPDVENTTYDGRSAWKLSIRFVPGEGGFEAFGARLDVVVDKETGLVLQVTRYAYDPERWTSIEKLQNLRIGVHTNADDFVVPKPANATEVAHDWGFRRTRPAEAKAIVGYQPLLPANTLGQQLTDFAVAKASRFPFPGIPARHNAVSARYGTGADAVTVSSYKGPVTDLPEIGSGRTIRLSRGPLAGDLASISISPVGAGVFTAFHAPGQQRWDLNARGLIVRITAPSTQEAIAVARSLRRTG